MVTYMNDLEYADRYVAFLDILGFSEITRRAHNDVEWRSFLRGIIRQIKDTLPTKNDKMSFRFVNFSDSIVISAKQDREGLVTVIQACEILVTNLMQRGILLRGGIAAGNLHHDDEILFGPGLLDAYAFEQQGGPPHIGLHPSVLMGMENSIFDEGSLLHLVAEDPWDLTPILDVFYTFQEYDPSKPYAGMVVWEEPARRIADIISKNVADAQHPPAVRSKWRWVEDYWNRSVSVKLILPTTDVRKTSNWSQ